MAITSIGYDGTVTEEPWTGLAALIGGAYRIGDDPAYFRPTIGGAGDRSVTIATGVAYGRGVMDTSDAAVVKNLAAASGSDRWDLICLHRDWTTNTTTIEVVTGGSSKAIPSRDVGYPKDDQPIALARVSPGNTAVQELVDLRVWGMVGGVTLARDALALDYVNSLGVVVRVGIWEYARILNTAGTAAEWSRIIPNLLLQDTAPTSAQGNNGEVVGEY